MEQLYTDAALMLDASPRVVAAAGSRLIDLHVPLASSTMADCAQQATVLTCSVVARKLTVCESHVDL